MPPLHPSQICVLVDTREQLPYDFTAAGFRMEAATLKHGDYSVKGMERFIALERKSVDDLLACMTTQRERFETELLALRGYRYRAIVVEYNLDKLLSGLWANDMRNPKRNDPAIHSIRSRMKWESAQGTIAAWAVRYCPILFTGNRNAGQQMAQRLIWEAAEAVYAPIAHLAPAQVSPDPPPQGKA